MNKLSLVLIILLWNNVMFSENDPFEDLNRTTLTLNKKLDVVFATPVARFYQKITPDFIELAVYNSISNIEDINISINNVHGILYKSFIFWFICSCWITGGSIMSTKSSHIDI